MIRLQLMDIGLIDNGGETNASNNLQINDALQAN